MNQLTSPALPIAWIDRLFARFATLYGKHWLDLWQQIPMEQVRAAWSEALSVCDGQQIRMGLEHCSTHNKYPPTAPEFVSLCREFPREYIPPPPRPPEPPAPALPGPKFYGCSLTGPELKKDGKDWARDIVRSHRLGIYHQIIGLEMAREVLAVYDTGFLKREDVPNAAVERPQTTLEPEKS
jgi:hypothetical protein